MKIATACSGIGAPEVASERLGWEHIFCSEIEPFPCRVLKHHFPTVENKGDFTKNAEWNIPSGSVDIFVAGTPCTGFSLAGDRRGLNDPRSRLAHSFTDFLAKYRPRWFVWENVPGVLSSGGGDDFKELIASFTDIGYGVAWRVLNSREFGVPQQRERVFVVGCFGRWESPARVLFEQESMCRNVKARRVDRKEDASKVGEGSAKRSEVICAISAQTNGLIRAAQDESRTLPSRMYKDPPIVVMSSNTRDTVWNREDETGAITAHASLEPPICVMNNTVCACEYATEGFAGTILASNHNKPMVVENHAQAGRYKLREDFQTLTARCGTGGGNLPMIIDPATSEEDTLRYLTPVECERLMGFPDNWTDVDAGPKGTAKTPRYKAIGNSIVVNVLEWLFARIETENRRIL